MNYEKHYMRLMLKAEKRQRENPNWADEIDTDQHHWYPRSMYPEWINEDWNIVTLTTREHFLSHWLLANWLKNDQMVKALWVMCIKQRYKTLSTTYENTRKLYSEIMTGETNPMKCPKRRANMSGENNPAKRPEVKAKIAAARRKQKSTYKWTEEHRTKYAATRTGMKYNKNKTPTSATSAN